MDDAQEQDQYEERLKEVFNGFDASGTGSLSPEELSDLCQSLHLGDATPALLQALIQNEDHLTGRVDFDQFKNALIVVLSSSIEAPQPQQEEDLPKPDSPVIQPKFVKGSKRYGRRSTPEFIEPVSDFTEVTNVNPVQGEEDPEEDYSAVPRKRERWNALETNTEEYEAEGQMHLWNPDEPSTPRGSIVPLSEQFEGRIREACDKLALPWDGCASHNELLGLCDHLGLEVTGDVVQSLSGDGAMTVQEFVTRVVSHSTPLTPSASTSYRQFKRLHSTQPFDEVGRRTVTPSAMTGTIGMRLFSTLDDGTGYIPVEYILDAWMEEGIENSAEILQALDFSLDGKLNLCELTMALENELLVTKNGIHQAALASFKAEIRHLLERVDRELREKEKIRTDLEKAEKLKSQLAAEVDEHHSAIERMNNLNLRKLEQDQKEKVAVVRSELIKEMDQIQQQAGLQREELEAEIEKIRGDETFLRDHLSISVKENRRVEMELLDSTEKLVEAHNQIAKLQEHLDKIVKEKFGDLDPGSADFLLQEERIKQLRSSYEAQCRELQDRIDELQSELQEFHSLGRVPQLCSKPLSEELESKSPGMESDPGLGSEDGQPFNMTLEAELMLEHLKEQHLRELKDLRAQLEIKVNEFDLMAQEQLAAHEEQKAAITLRYQEEVHALKEEIAGIQNHERELRKQLEHVELERADLEQKQAGEREELENLQEEEVANLSQRLLEAHTHIADLEEQLKSLEFHHAETEVNMDTAMERLKERHALALNKTDEGHEELLKATLEEQRTKLMEEGANVLARLLEDWEREKEQLQQSHEDELKVRLEEVSVRFRGEHEELQRNLTEEWKKEKAQMKEQSNEALQTELEEGIQRLFKEQEEKERKLKEEWETELAELQEAHEDMMHTRLTEERLKQEQREGRLREEWEGDKLQLEENYERMLQDQLKEEREKLEAERKEAKRRLDELMEDEKARLQESHRVAMRELTTKHSEERERLGGMLDQLREDIAVERTETNRLAEENHVLQHKLATLKEEDLKEAYRDLQQKLERLKKEKIAAQKMAETFKKQISGLYLRSQQLEEENALLSEKNAQNDASVETLSQQLTELIKETERRESVPAEERTQMAACVSALEADLTKALEDTVHLEGRNSHLTHQLCALREKVQTVDETVQLVNLQNARLKSDLRVIQQEKDALRQEVLSLHKQLQNANDKNHVLEMTLNSSGFQSQHKKLFREKISRLQEQEQQLLKQENERLQVEVCNTKGELVHSRDKVRQLEATIVSLKQQKQQVKALEQENAALKQELENKKELTKFLCENGEGNVESLQQENEALKAQMAHLSSQLLETLQSQFVGMLPPSPHRVPRGQHRGDDDNMQGERERKMRNMEERLKEIELSLHNVKLLLKEKVVQLKDQLHKNGKADVLIKDLYVENDHLLKTLDMTEQRHKIAVKKNYLLEEKISSLNKILRDLNPSPLPTTPYY